MKKHAQLFSQAVQPLLLSDSVSPAAVRTARTWAEKSPGF